MSCYETACFSLYWMFRFLQSELHNFCHVFTTQKRQSSTLHSSQSYLMNKAKMFIISFFQAFPVTAVCQNFRCLCGTRLNNLLQICCFLKPFYSYSFRIATATIKSTVCWTVRFSTNSKRLLLIFISDNSYHWTILQSIQCNIKHFLATKHLHLNDIYYFTLVNMCFYPS